MRHQRKKLLLKLQQTIGDFYIVTIYRNGSGGDIHIYSSSKFNKHSPQVIYLLEHFNGQVVYKNY